MGSYGGALSGMWSGNSGGLVAPLVGGAYDTIKGNSGQPSFRDMMKFGQAMRQGTTPPPAVDPFDAMIKEASLAMIRREQAAKGRQQNFVTGPRGLEGPMWSMIGNGGTSLLGS